MNEEQEKSERLPFEIVETMPYILGGDGKDSADRKLYTEKVMLDYIYEHLEYPTIASQERITGLVVIQFTVNSEGIMEEINIAKDIGGGCGLAAKKVVQKLANEVKWQPGTQKHKAVSVKYNLPIRFKKLQKKWWEFWKKA